MKKKLLIATTFMASLAITTQPSLSQMQPAQGFGSLILRPTSPEAAPKRNNAATQMQGMVSAWQNERDPSKKRSIAIEIQKSLGVKADGIIGNQTLGAINQMGGMPPPRAGGGQAGTSVVDFGGSQFRGANPAPTRGGFLGGLFGARPATAPQGQPGLSNMMNAWQNETDPTKKARLARQIQTRVGVKADGVIGNQTMKAIQQAGGMPGGGGMGGPAPQGGFGQPGMSPQGGFGQPNQGGGFDPFAQAGQIKTAPRGGGLFGGLFAPRRAAAPGLTNMMNEWEMEPDPNKKRMIAMEIQRGLGVKADGVIGNQTMKAIQQAGGMPGGGGMGGPAPQGGFGQTGMNPQGGFGQQPPKQGGFLSGIFGGQPNRSPQGGFGQPGMNPQGGFGQPGMNPQGGFGQPGMNPQGGFGQPGMNPQGGFGQPGMNPQGGFGQPGIHGGGMHGGGMHGGGMHGGGGMPGGGGMGGPGPGDPGPGGGGPGPGDGGGGGPGPGDGGGEPKN